MARTTEQDYAHLKGQTPHIRARMPRKGGNSFYRDKNDYTKFVRTLCGVPVTEWDVDYRSANTAKFRTSGWPICLKCLRVQDDLQDKVIAALPDVFSKAVRS